MKLFFDFCKRLFSRLLVLFLIASVFIVLEAYKNMGNSSKNILDEIAVIKTAISKKESQIDALENKHKNLIKDICKIADKHNRKKDCKTANPAKIAKMFPKWIKAKKIPLKIIIKVKDTGKLYRKLASLNTKLTITQTSNVMDEIFQHPYPTDLLTEQQKWILLLLAYALFLGTLSTKAINYYLFAPLSRKSKPIIINTAQQDSSQLVTHDAAQKEFQLSVDKNHALIVKPDWYSMNTDGSTKTRFFWEWTKPFASYAIGLVNMTEFKTEDNDINRTVKIASESDPNHCIIPVHLKNHPGYVIRHDHIIAISGNEISINKQWRLWDWKSWLYGNLRYVYLTGTGTVYVYGYGNVSSTKVTTNNRVKERHIIGFDSTTPFKVIRTETFINYWINDKPLYDIYFLEHGEFLQQQSFGKNSDRILRSFIEDVFGAMGRFLGF